MDTRTVVEHYFQYVNTGQWDEWLALFDTNVVMDEQLLGRVVGADALAQGIEGLRDDTNFKNYPQRFVVEGNRAMVQWNIKSIKADGSPLDVEGVNYFEIEDGKIKYFANFHDTVPFK